jgi:hypothetical protein
MKKVVFIMMACLLCLTSCKHKKPERTPVPFPGYNFEKVMNEDIQTYLKDGVFYESELLFDTCVLTEGAKLVHIINVFQHGDTCTQVVHNELGELKVIKVRDYWLEDLPIAYPDSVRLTLGAAIKALGRIDNANAVITTKFCTLRRPVYKEYYPYAFYIFGDVLSESKFYAVNSNTGEVTEM